SKRRSARRWKAGHGIFRAFSGPGRSTPTVLKPALFLELSPVDLALGEALLQDLHGAKGSLGHRTLLDYAVSRSLLKNEIGVLRRLWRSPRFPTGSNVRDAISTGSSTPR